MTGFLLTPWPVLSDRLSNRYESGLRAGIGLLVPCAGMLALPWILDALATAAAIALPGAEISFARLPRRSTTPLTKEDASAMRVGSSQPRSS